ncbi:MAG: hypothetical protein C4543_07280 [Ignavibacteriales bacterium]|jgi:hemerythrin|nr:MAG: hypothetical protein C4543_07280 [Ignavibacteriales bacterium]
MSKINYELTLYHSPYHDILIEELSSIIKQKKSIYRNIQTESDFYNKLSYEEKEILKHLITKEDKILYELIQHKGWITNLVDHKDYFSGGGGNENEDDIAHHFGY